MGTDDSVEVGLGAWTPPEPYTNPELEPEGQIPTEEIVGLEATNLDRELGKEVAVYSLQGKCYEKDISTFQKYKGRTLSLRHEVHSGDVFIESVRAESTDTWDEVEEFRFQDGEMQDVRENKRVHKYYLKLIDVAPIDDTNSPD